MNATETTLSANAGQTTPDAEEHSWDAWLADICAALDAMPPQTGPLAAVSVEEQIRSCLADE